MRLGLLRIQSVARKVETNKGLRPAKFDRRTGQQEKQTRYRQRFHWNLGLGITGRRAKISAASTHEVKPVEENIMASTS